MENLMEFNIPTNLSSVRILLKKMPVIYILHLYFIKYHLFSKFISNSEI